MKKLLLALPLLTLPLTAMAQDKPTQAQKEVISGLATALTDALCEGGIKKVATGPYICYENTPKNDPTIENCIIVDFFTLTELQKRNDQAKAMGEPTNNIPYFSEDTFNKRIKSYLDLPQYKKYTEKEIMNYFMNSQEAVRKEIIKLQQIFPCKQK